MAIMMILIAGMFDVVQLPQTYSPAEVLANTEELYQATLSPKQDPLIVRFRVGYIKSQTVHNVPEDRTYNQIMIHPQSGGIKNATFHVAITPEAEKEFKRLGITNLKKHFKGKEIEIQGRLSVSHLNLYGSPTFYKYHIDIKDLDQVRMIKPIPVDKSESISEIFKGDYLNVILNQDCMN